MRFCLAVLLLLVTWPAQAAGFDKATRRYLEGIWLVGQMPDKGDCLSGSYEKMQLEFEFRKSGGRVLVFEPFDLFTPITLSGAEWASGILQLSVRARDGAELPYLRLRLQRPDRLELLPKAGAGPEAKSEIAYRCGRPNRTVNAAVPMDRLALLTPNVSGGESFIEAVPGIADGDICAGTVKEGWKIRPRPRVLQFELIGPVHYWVFGQNFGHGQGPEFDNVRSVEAIDGHRLKLHMQKHSDVAGGRDLPKNRGGRYDLTIIDRGGRFEIPEWSASFIHCSPDDPNTPGMHRY